MTILVFLSLCALCFLHNPFLTITKSQISIHFEDDSQSDYHHEDDHQEPFILTRTDLPDTLENQARDSPIEIVHLQDSLTRPKRQAIKYRKRRWPHALMYYKIDNNFTVCQKGAIRSAMDHIMAETCIRFVNWDTIQRPYERYLLIRPAEPNGLGYCYASDLGYNASSPQQFVELLTNNCFVTISHVIHEIMHALGVDHTMSRQDRDQYIDVIYNYIYPEHRWILNVNTNLKTYGLPYDYNSIMHYPNLGKGNLGLPWFPTMTWKKNPSVCLGQMVRPTNCDWELLRLMYHCYGRQGTCQLTPFKYMKQTGLRQNACPYEYDDSD